MGYSVKETPKTPTGTAAGIIARNRRLTLKFTDNAVQYNMSKKPPNKKPNEAPKDAKPGKAKPKKPPRTLWHPAMARVVEFELEDNRKDLSIEVEHQLTTEPLRIDILIIKLKRNVVLKKNFARIFRRCNIIEYKSPLDSVSVQDYHRTHGYARVYASLKKVSIDDLSATIVTTRHPRSLLAFLRKRFKVCQEQPGIYVVEGEVYPTQIVVVTELSGEENKWLASLRKDLTLPQLSQACAALIGKPNIGPVIVALANGNPEVWEEYYMKDVVVSKQFDAYFTDKYAAPWMDKAKDEKAAEIARNMKKRGDAPAAIAEVTGLSAAEIKRLK
jgi:hypothetical protein